MIKMGSTMEQPTATLIQARYGRTQGNATFTTIHQNCPDNPERKVARRRAAVEKSTPPSVWWRANQFIEN
jgi:hypothetical protein